MGNSITTNNKNKAYWEKKRLSNLFVLLFHVPKNSQRARARYWDDFVAMEECFLFMRTVLNTFWDTFELSLLRYVWIVYPVVIHEARMEFYRCIEVFVLKIAGGSANRNNDTTSDNWEVHAEMDLEITCLSTGLNRWLWKDLCHYVKVDGLTKKLLSWYVWKLDYCSHLKRTFEEYKLDKMSIN